MSGTYKIDGAEITLQPSSGKWLSRRVIGVDGNGHHIYPSVYQFEMDWSISDQSEWNQLIGFFDSLAITGSAVVDLPQYRSSTYQFYSYTGCVVHEPEIGEYFTEHPTRISLLVSKIRA